MDSILDSVKKSLGIETDDESFDTELILHINSVMSTLNDIGVGPPDGFAIEDKDAVWADLIGNDLRFNDVKQYVYLKVRVIFDPPTTSFQLVQSMRDTATELEWRINARREGNEWVDPNPTGLLLELEPTVIIVPVDQAWISE